MWFRTHLAECLPEMREALGLSPNRATFIYRTAPVTVQWPLWVHAQAASCKKTVSWVSAWFQAVSGTYLCGSGSDGRVLTRQVSMGSSLGLDTFFSSLN